MSANNVTALNVSTSRKDQLIDITKDVVSVVRQSGVKCGVCYVYVPHTTAAVTINENADPDVVSDIIMGLEAIVPNGLSYRHAEGNSTAHIKSSMIGISEEILINDGSLVLGTWQGIYFCEFDGPRSRKVYVKVVEG